MTKRIFDLCLCFLALIPLSIPLLLTYIAVRLTSRGPALHWSKRVGVDNNIFLMPKFRSMKIDTPQLPTHLMTEPKKYLTPIGQFIRKTSLDELPQIFSVLTGDMSFVGPRPALFNQEDLIAIRTQSGVHKLRPGITGWAQVNGRDELPIPVKAQFDSYYLQNKSVLFDIKILFYTVAKVLAKDGVSH